MFLLLAHGVEHGVHCDGDRWSHLESLISAGWDSSSSPWNPPLGRPLITAFSRLTVGSWEFVVSPWQVSCTICKWEHTFISILSDQCFHGADSSRTNFWCIQIFQFFQINQQSDYLLSIIPPRSMHIPERFLAILSFQIDEFSFDHVLQWDDIQPMLQMELWDLWLVLRIVSHNEFSRPQIGLERLADSNSIPRNRTTISHAILTLAIQLTLLLSLFVLLVQQCRSMMMTHASKRMADVPRMSERTRKLAKSQFANLTLLSPQTHISESANSFTFSLYERLKLTRTSPHTLPPSTCTRDSGAFVVWMKTTWWPYEQVSTPIHRQPVREIPGIYGGEWSPRGPWRFGNECCLQWFHCILMPSLHAWTVFTVKTGLALRLKAWTCTHCRTGKTLNTETLFL